jgi:septum site-determining protein MinD
LGKETILIDNNLTTPNIGLHLGLTNTDTTLHHVLQGKKKIHHAIHHHPLGLKFIPGSLSLNDMQGLKLNNLKSIRDLDADYIILDGAAGLGREAIATIEHCDELLIITNPELPSITDALKAIKAAEEFNKPIKGIIITRKKEDSFEVSNKNIESMLEYPIIAIIPEDSSVKESQVMKDSVILTHPDSKAAQAYLKLASSLCNVPFYPKKESLIQKFLNLFK